jgi:hypothetical protein
VERRFYQNPRKYVNTIFSDFFTADFRRAAAPAFTRGYDAPSRSSARE